MYDENGQEIRRGDQVVATKTRNKITRIYEGTVVGIRSRQPQVLVRVIKSVGMIWFYASCIAVQISEEGDS